MHIHSYLTLFRLGGMKEGMGGGGGDGGIKVTPS